MRHQADDYVRAGQTANWESAAAQEYRDRVAHDSARLHKAADALDDAAAALIAHAQNVRETLAEIARIERVATDWFEDKARALRDEAANAFDAAKRGISILIHEAPWKDWPIGPLNLPAAGDKGWLDVGHFLRGQGVL